MGSLYCVSRHLYMGSIGYDNKWGCYALTIDLIHRWIRIWMKKVISFWNNWIFNDLIWISICDWREFAWWLWSLCVKDKKMWENVRFVSFKSTEKLCIWYDSLTGRSKVCICIDALIFTAEVAEFDDFLELFSDTKDLR